MSLHLFTPKQNISYMYMMCIMSKILPILHLVILLIDEIISQIKYVVSIFLWVEIHSILSWDTIQQSHCTSQENR